MNFKDCNLIFKVVLGLGDCKSSICLLQSDISEEENSRLFVQLTRTTGMFLHPIVAIIRYMDNLYRAVYFSQDLSLNLLLSQVIFT